MNKIKTLVLALSATFAFTACGGDDVISQMEDMKKKACACKDMACFEKLTKDNAKAGEEMKKKMDKMSDADKKKAAKIGEEMSECIMKLATPPAGAAPAPAPAGE